MNARLRLLFPYILLLGVIGVVVVANVPRAGHPVATTTMCAPCGMEVDPGDAVAGQYNGRTLFFCTEHCRDEFSSRQVATADQTAQTSTPSKLVDVVCKMEVNRAWGIGTTHDEKEYYFCADRCRRLFDSDPDRYLAAKCIVCGDVLAGPRDWPATYLGKTYQLCSQPHRTQFKSDPASFFMHSMWGIPPWMYYASIAIVLILSFGIFEWVGGQRVKSGLFESFGAKAPSVHAMTSIVSLPVLAGSGAPLAAMTGKGASIDIPARSDRFDLFSIPLIKAAMHSRVFRFVLQAFFALAFLLIVAAGLFGNQNPALNIAPILTWTVWWGALIILILFAGKAWCYVCPWDALARWTEKLAFWKKNDDGLSLGWRWPRAIRNILLATIMFVGLTWIELGFGVTMRPRVTAYLALAMLLMAVVSAMLFDRKSFCRYGCLVGRVSGLYALFSSVEVRAKKHDTCKSCGTKECVKGSETAYGCPTFLYPGGLQTNTYCIQCMECVQACPHDNLTVNLRPWGSDLAVEGKPRADEAYLALLMLAITGFHGLTMTPVWAQLVEAIRAGTGAGRIIGFSVGMVLLMLGPICIYALLVAISQWIARSAGHTTLSYRDYFIRYAYALLPIALFYHIAHNLEHLLLEGPKVLAMISDPFGWGWNLLGTAHWNIPPLISLPMLWVVQAFLVLVGHVYSLWVARKTSVRLFGSASVAFRSQLPMLCGMIAFSVFSLWLLKQPMEMRTSAM